MHFLTLLFHLTASAYALTTAYVSFEHPDGWRCELSQGVWICQSSVETDRKESVILSIATMATEWDTLDNYLNYLKQSRTIQDEDGTTLTAKVSYSRKRNINGVEWVDSLQHNSELPGFWARYLATVHTTGNTKLAILITYIVSEERYSQLAQQFERMIASLKPNAEFDLNIPSKQVYGELPGSAKVGPSIRKDLLIERLGGRKKPTEKNVEAPPPAKGTPWSVAVLLALILGSGFLLFRRIRRGRSAPREPTPPSRSGPPAHPPATKSAPGKRTEPTSLGGGGRKKVS